MEGVLPFITSRALNRPYFAYYGLYGRWRCIQPLASCCLYPKPSSEIRGTFLFWFSSYVQQTERTLRTMDADTRRKRENDGFENATRVRVQDPLRTRWGAEKARTPIWGKGRQPDFLVASIASLPLLNSQKLRDFWSLLWRQYLPYCPSFHFHLCSNSGMANQIMLHSTKTIATEKTQYLKF